MSEIYSPYAPSTQDNSGNGVDQNFLNKVFLWMAFALGSTAVGAIVIGPLIPQGMLWGLYFVTLIALLGVGFTRKMYHPTVSGIFAIAVPGILGAILYPTLNYYFASGQGGVVAMSAIAASTLFLVMGAVGWMTQRSMSGWLPYMFGILVGIIALSLLNAFVFQLSGLSLVISIGVLILFAVYTSVDMQRLRQRVMREGNVPEEIPASWYALNLFLDLFNMFVALLNILGGRR